MTMNEYAQGELMVRYLHGAAADDDRPTIVLTGVQCDTPGAVIAPGFADITVPVGSTLGFTAELRDSEDAVLPVDDTFRMPIRSRDGRERVVLAGMVQGVITFSVTFTESRVWEVTQDVINADLPAEAHMRFAGVRVFAVEA